MNNLMEGDETCFQGLQSVRYDVRCEAFALVGDAQQMKIKPTGKHYEDTTEVALFKKHSINDLS